MLLWLSPHENQGGNSQTSLLTTPEISGIENLTQMSDSGDLQHTLDPKYENIENNKEDSL